MMKKVCMIALILSVGVLSAQQRGPQSLAQLEESPAGSKIITYVKMVNEKTEVSNGWIEDLFAPKLIESAGIDRLKGLVSDSRNNEGQLHVYEVRRTSMFRYKLKVKGVKSGEWLDMVFTFEENEPYRIMGITLDNSDSASSKDSPIFPKV